jgi:hypothetical protein
MSLKEDLPLHRLDGETIPFVEEGKVSCHEEELVVLWCDTQLF